MRLQISIIDLWKNDCFEWKLQKRNTPKEDGRWFDKNSGRIRINGYSRLARESFSNKKKWIHYLHPRRSAD
jgi:hypothetical protein